MKHKIVFSFLLLWIGGIPSLKAQEKTTHPPNIIVFLVDDMGWQDTSVPFWDSVKKLARKPELPIPLFLSKETERRRAIE